MKFGKKIEVNSLPIDNSTIELLYPGSLVLENRENADLTHINRLKHIITFFQDEIGNLEREFMCFIEKKALDAFVAFANEIYQSTHNEATGIIVGYYLHDANNPNKKIIVGTNFLQATGSASNVTCEFSYQDSIRHSMYCDKYKVLPIVWIHSHPGFGVFYSSTDSSTLRGYFNCDHQMGVVVDNIQNQYLGFKIYNGQQCVEDIFLFDIDHCIETGKLEYKNISYNNINSSDTGLKIEKKKSINYKNITEQYKPKSSKHPISFNTLNELSSQLRRFEQNGSFDTFIKYVNSLGLLVDSLKEITGPENTYSLSPFSKEDMKQEIVSQIQGIVGKLEDFYHTWQKNTSVHSETLEDIQKLKACIEEIKRSCQNQTTLSQSVLTQLETITVSIQGLMENNPAIKEQEETKNSSVISFCKKHWLSIILSIALVISIIINICQKVQNGSDNQHSVNPSIDKVE